MAPGLAQQPLQNGSASLDYLQPDDDDLLYEEELLRNPYSLKMWWRYLEARRDAPAQKRYILYERALKALPVSYKVCCCPSGVCSRSSRRAPWKFVVIFLSAGPELPLLLAAVALISAGASEGSQGAISGRSTSGGAEQYLPESAGVHA